MSGRSRLDRSSSRSWRRCSGRSIGTASRGSRFAAGRDAAVAASAQQARTSGDASTQVAQATQQIQRRTAARICSATAVSGSSVSTAARSSGNFVHAASWASSDRAVGAARRSSSRGAAGVTACIATAIEQGWTRDGGPVDAEPEVDQTRTTTRVRAIAGHSGIAATARTSGRCFAARRSATATTHAQHTIQQIASKALAAEHQRSGNHQQSRLDFH